MTETDLILKIVNDHLDPFDLNEEHLTIAELKSTPWKESIRSVDSNTALISPKLFKRIKPSHTNPFVNTTGASYQEEWAYTPSFWLYLSKSPGLKNAEPLVISWSSDNFTTLLPDQGLLKTFNLIPKMVGEQTLWHDLSRPVYDVVINKPISRYDFPEYTEAHVKIRAEYLKDYLLLRKKSAVQVFTVKTELAIDETVTRLLNGKEHFIGEAGAYEIRLRKPFHKDDAVHLEINGFRFLFDPEAAKTETAPVIIGHTWKGIDGLVDNWRARHELPGEVVYVSDDVLAVYESQDDYEVHPETGGVSYLRQWSVSHCERLGRNGIKIELKKLYEGTPYEVIDHWNKFSIDRSEIKRGENIEQKSRRLIRKYFLFGRVIANLINRACNFDYTATQIISLDEAYIDYTGWTEFPEYQQISCHVPVRGFSRDQFMLRCKSLYQLLGENLQEAKIRKVITTVGFPESELTGFRSLKLMELLIKYLSVARDSGLDIAKDQTEIVERTLELKDYFPLSDLGALAAIRNLGSHKGGDIKTKLQVPLKALGIEPKGISSSYAFACDAVYDRLIDLFSNLNLWLVDL